MADSNRFNDTNLRIVQCRSPERWAAAKSITATYVDWLAIDLSFQDYKTEMAQFEQVYGPPDGCYLIAMFGDLLAGGVGIRRIGEGICEMKRMYVFEEFRGKGVGRRLGEALIQKAAALGYHQMRLDTLARLERANELYRKMGFYDIPAYRINPEPDVRYMECLIGEK